MKKTFCIIATLLVLMSQKSVAQQKNTITASSIWTNDFIYSDLENIISISFNDGVKHNFIARVDNDTNVIITPIGNNRFKIQLLNYRKENLQLTIYEKKGDENTFCGVRNYDVKKLNLPRLKLRKHQASAKNYCDLAALKNSEFLKVEYNNNWLGDDFFKVINYRFTCIGRRTNGPNVISFAGDSLAPIQSLVNMLGDGDLIQFDKIKVKGANGSVYWLNIEGYEIESINGNGKLERYIKSKLFNDSLERIKLQKSINNEKQVRLTKASLTKNISDYLIGRHYNDISIFRKNLITYEYENGKFKNLQFNETKEIAKSNGLVKQETITMLKQRPGSDDPTDLVDTTFIDTIDEVPTRIFFDEKMNDLTNENSWYLFAEYKNRIIAIPITEFVKEDAIAPQIVSNYLCYLRKKNIPEFNKYNNFLYDSPRWWDSRDSISKGQLEFFEESVKFHLANMYFRIVTGTKDDISSIYGKDYSTDLVQTWDGYVDWRKFKLLTNYNPVWTNPFSGTEEIKRPVFNLSHSKFIESLAENVVDGGGGFDTLYHYFDFDKLNGFELLNTINPDGMTSTCVILQFNKFIMGQNYFEYLCTPLSDVISSFDDLDKIILSNMHNYNYADLKIAEE
jgi:hypothetical protein